jgi:hypothetical protein
MDLPFKEMLSGRPCGAFLCDKFSASSDPLVKLFYDFFFWVWPNLYEAEIVQICVKHRQRRSKVYDTGFGAISCQISLVPTCTTSALPSLLVSTELRDHIPK